MRGKLLISLVLAAWMLPAIAVAATIPVNPGESIQDAIDAADPNDVIQLGTGTYFGHIDFDGKAVAVVGEGPGTILAGIGGGPVVTFDSGEGPGSVIDSVVITDGEADRGAGIHVNNFSDPTIVRTILFHNRARLRGSGIYVASGSEPLISNNLIIYNRNTGGDPHGIQVENAAPLILNNSLIRNDSNGILLSGISPALIMNNMFVRNGSRGRGRGICDFSGGNAMIQYNLFHRNRKSAVLTNGKDFKGIGSADRRFGPPRFFENVSTNPRLLMRNPPRLDSRRFEMTALATFVAEMRPRLDGRMNRRRAVDSGNPDPIYNDLDGSRNDMGFTGGPDAPTW